MKILLITYYWPPAGGSGVQRWVKFVKYLQDFGITPIVYVPENPSYPTEDHTLLAEIPAGVTVLKQPIRTLQDRLAFSKKTKENKQAHTSNGGFLSWVRGNFFIPDPKISWVQPSVAYLETYLKEHPVDAIISSGPPHSMHLIALALQQKAGVKWVADFRDPWTGLYYNKDFRMHRLVQKKHQQLEKKVLKSADLVLTVSDTLQKEFAKTSKRVCVVSNGYDDEVFSSKTLLLDRNFSIAHIGLLPKQSNPIILWKVLADLCKESSEFSKDLKICLTGTVHEDAIASIRASGLEKHLEHQTYVPHTAAIVLQQQAQVLLLVLPNTTNIAGVVTGKIFEYITAKRPILAIGPKGGDLDRLLQNTATGTLVGFEDADALKEKIQLLYANYKKGDTSIVPRNIEQYHRRNLTEKLAKHLKELL